MPLPPPRREATEPPHVGRRRVPWQAGHGAAQRAQSPAWMPLEQHLDRLAHQGRQRPATATPAATAEVAVLLIRQQAAAAAPTATGTRHGFSNGAAPSPAAAPPRPVAPAAAGPRARARRRAAAAPRSLQPTDRRPAPDGPSASAAGRRGRPAETGAAGCRTGTGRSRSRRTPPSPTSHRPSSAGCTSRAACSAACPAARPRARLPCSVAPSSTSLTSSRLASS